MCKIRTLQINIHEALADAQLRDMVESAESPIKGVTK